MIDEVTERALRDLIDRDQVVSLLDRYFAAVDDGTGLDVDWARSIFSEDVRIEHRGFVLQGLEDIATGNRMVREGWDRTFHLSSNHRVDLDGDRAEVRARLLAIHLHPGATPPDPYLIANFVDAVAVRTSDGWRLQRLGFDGVWTSGTSHFDIDRSEP